MKVRYWGVRGSIPVPGVTTQRYGGNSSCVEVRGEGAPPLVLDCGTGVRDLGRQLIMERATEVFILLTHFHTDHVFGFPFFGPLYSPNCRVVVCVPAYSEVEVQEKLNRYLNGVNHPVRLRDFPAQMSFVAVKPGRPFTLGPYRVQGVALNHPGGSMGYRIEHGGEVVAYITDTAPLAAPGEGVAGGQEPPRPEQRLLEAVQDANLVIMDTMFEWEEYLEKMTWGHAYPAYGVSICQAANARHLVLFHHAPDATDEELDARRERWECDGPVRVTLAVEGVVDNLSTDSRTP